MKFRTAWLPLLAAALAVPGAVRAQDDDECPCRRPGMIGVVFQDDDEDGDGVRIIEVRRGSPAEAAGVREGDVVIRLNGRDANEALDDLPEELEEGDTVRMRIRRGGDDRDVVIVAAPRPATRFGFVRPGEGREPMIFMGPDSFNIPLEALTMRLDSLNTRLFHLDSGLVRLRVDSLVNLFSDSANVFIQRLPNIEFRVEGPELEALEQGMIWRTAPGEERPFFMELGRRAAAGAELAEINEGLRRYFDGVENGALVIEVSPNSPAARAGLEPGDVIVRAGGREVNDPEDVRNALMREEDGTVALEVVRHGRRREVNLEWEGDRVIRREIAPARVRGRVDRRVEPRRAEPSREPRN